MKTFISDNNKYHYYMWRWLSRHPEADKDDWPGFKKIKKPVCCCFACKVASEKAKNPRGYCLRCPIKKWRSSSTHALVRCANYGSPFNSWTKHHNVKDVALQISELEWEE